MKISIIIPIYNGEKYLKKVVSKILEQPHKDIELILVNDGSIDSSLSICKEYEKKDDRVKVINKENGGICSARNAGLRIATGTWISFVDQDDEISENMYEDFNAAISDDTDMIVAGKQMHLIDENGNIINKKDYIYDYGLVNADESIELLLNKNQDLCLMHLWNCIYKREILEKGNLVFEEQFKYGHEDSLFNIEYYALCKKINFIKPLVYIYYRRQNISTSLKSNINYISDYALYARRASLALEKKDNYYKNVFYAYLLRLGINLFCEYGKQSNEPEKDLQGIYNVIFEIMGWHAIKKNSVANKRYWLFLNVINMLLRCHQYYMVYFLLKIVKS